MSEALLTLAVSMLVIAGALLAVGAYILLKVEREIHQMRRKSREAARRFDGEGRLVTANVRRQVFIGAKAGRLMGYFEPAAAVTTERDDDFLRSIGVKP